MKTSKKRQVLTSGVVDRNGNQISPDVIDWSEFDTNPVLLYNPESEGHGGVVVGKVVDRERIGDTFVGRLSFVERVEAAETAREKYEQGALPYVSIGGYAAGKYDEEREVFVASQYLIKEVSLVKFPANPDAKTLDEKTVKASEKWFFEGRTVEGEEVRYLTMSVNASEDEKSEEVNASEDEKSEEVNASENRPLPEGMTWHEHEQLNQVNQAIMDKTFQQLNCDADFQKRMSVLNASLRGSTTADKTPENSETVKILAEAMLRDERMVIIASAANFTNGVTKECKNGLQFLIECAAGGAAAATLAAADLGVIKWLSLFYERLLPNNTFMRSLRFVPMSDREGAIYVESGINPATYIGSTTPVNAQHYLYDDIKRTIARQVFSIQPVTFQNADMAILAYDKQGWGWRTAMDSLMSDVCTYVLQVVANTPNIAKIGTSGKAFSAVGAFPLEAPNSDLSLKGLTAQDLINMSGTFLKQNYRLDDRMVEVILPAVMFTNLAASDEFITNLTRDLEGAVRNELRFMGNRITPRNPVARYDTATNKPVLAEALYADGTVNATTGAITAITDSVAAKTLIGAGIAFVENEVIAGIGKIDVIVMPDPANYGITMSGWMSAGATVARQDGKGAALIVPTVNA